MKPTHSYAWPLSRLLYRLGPPKQLDLMRANGSMPVFKSIVSTSGKLVLRRQAAYSVKAMMESNRLRPRLSA